MAIEHRHRHPTSFIIREEKFKLVTFFHLLDQQSQKSLVTLCYLRIVEKQVLSYMAGGIVPLDNLYGGQFGNTCEILRTHILFNTAILCKMMNFQVYSLYVCNSRDWNHLYVEHYGPRILIMCILTGVWSCRKLRRWDYSSMRAQM